MHVVGAAQPFEHDDELVTAQAACRLQRRQRAGHRVAAAHGAVQAAGHQAQQFVAGGGA